jgi:hypothetical protein
MEGMRHTLHAIKRHITKKATTMIRRRLLTAYLLARIRLAMNSEKAYIRQAISSHQNCSEAAAVVHEVASHRGDECNLTIYRERDAR